MQTFGFLSAELSYLTQVATQSISFFDISEENVENTQKGGQNGHLVTFSGPWLTWATRKLRAEVTSSPGQARLLLEEATSSSGELLWNLHPSFPINRRVGAEEKGLAS